MSYMRFTVEMPIRYTVGRRHNFCCRGPILIPRPDSETSAQTTRVNVLGVFVKPKNGVSESYTKRRQIKTLTKTCKKSVFRFYNKIK